ncbi:MAG: phosphatidylglycerol lysyltransferase domain-containing protein [Gemmatimonadales bacterium]|jgi:hypothetical protein|nr:phosphatidylglycerol lysyltransferase domain-containing protein [Gemmatimonadales bacterium]
MPADFLGIGLEPVTLADQGRIGPILERHPQPLSGYTFASLICWNPVFHYGVGVADDDTLIVSCCPGTVPECHLLQPVGPFGLPLQERLVTRARELPYPLRIISASEEFVARHRDFVARFEVAPNRDLANYVYGATELAELPGRRHAKKRNLIAQAQRLYEWTVEPLRAEHRGDCLSVADDIASKRTAESGVTLDQETVALGRALELFAPLGLQGLLLRVAGQPAAFSIFERLGPSTAVVMFERALRSFKGLYQVINQETARVLVQQGYELINREEDLGDPGLRQAKESYSPLRLDPAFTLTLRR